MSSRRSSSTIGSSTIDDGTADPKPGEVVEGSDAAVDINLLKLRDGGNQGGPGKDIHELWGEVGALAEVSPRGNVLAMVVRCVGEECVHAVEAAEFKKSAKLKRIRYGRYIAYES